MVVRIVRVFSYFSCIIPRYTRVSGTGGPGAKTSVHAILDYDDDFDDYYEHEEQNVPRDAQVTPIQGPIFLKNGSVPVVPLYSYPSLNNGTFVQIPVSRRYYRLLVVFFFFLFLTLSVSIQSFLTSANRNPIFSEVMEKKKERFDFRSVLP